MNLNFTYFETVNFSMGASTLPLDHLEKYIRWWR